MSGTLAIRSCSCACNSPCEAVAVDEQAGLMTQLGPISHALGRPRLDGDAKFFFVPARWANDQGRRPSLLQAALSGKGRDERTCQGVTRPVPMSVRNDPRQPSIAASARPLTQPQQDWDWRRPVHGREKADRVFSSWSVLRSYCSAESATMSLTRGDSPSTFAVPETGRERRAAKERAAAKARSADQRSANAEVHAARDAAGAARARHRASSLTNRAAWRLQRPPTSRPKTKKNHATMSDALARLSREERTPGFSALVQVS